MSPHRTVTLVALFALAVSNFGCANLIAATNGEPFNATERERRRVLMHEEEARHQEILRRIDRAAADIPLLDSVQLPPGYVNLGFVQVEDADPQQALHNLRVQCVLGGADAVVDMQRSSGDSSSSGVATPLFGSVFGSSRTFTSTIWSAKLVRLPKSPEVPEVTIGTGFFVTDSGYFVTAAHVVEGAGLVAISITTGRYPATLIATDKDADLALLKVDGIYTTPAILGVDEAVKRGEKLSTLGFPMINVQGIAAKFTSGEVNALTGFRDDPSQLQISVPIQPGNSGGPLFAENGEVAGVIIASLNSLAVVAATGAVPQNVNYATKVSRVWALLRHAQIAWNRAEELHRMPHASTFEDSSVGLVIVRH